MKLKELLKDITLRSPLPNLEIEIQSLTEDSRTVGKNSLFFARRGKKTSGLNYIDEAIKNGAVVVLTEESLKHSVPNLLRVESMIEAQNSIAKRFYKNPSEYLTVIGVTGTNGKTTFTYMLESIAIQMGWRVGVIGTINYRLPKENSLEIEIIPSVNTTPNGLELQRIFSLMKHRGVDLVIMEVSSHALSLDRVRGIEFDGAVFTNLTQDHLDFHKNMESYFKSKSKLFEGMNRRKKGHPGAPNKFTIINADDSYGRLLVPTISIPVISYGIDSESDFMAKKCSLSQTGTHFILTYKSEIMDIILPLIGRHNIYNALGAIATGIQLGIPLSVIQSGLKKLHTVPGRLEAIQGDKKFTVLVDYAHTEDALKNVLQSLKPLAKRKILTLFGCGGDRDRTKRPLMGAMASQLSDWVIITSDNPRTEDPEKIIKQIESGIIRLGRKNYSVVIDRVKAIETILTMAKDEDIVLIAGKGHETVQIFKNKTVLHDDREIAKKMLCTH